MTTSQRWTRRLSTSAAGTAALLLVGGVAYATWSATGAGSGASAVGTTTPLTAVAVISATLYPGSSADLTVMVSNPNQRPVTVTSIAATGVIIASAGCTAPGVTAALPATVSVTIPAGGSAPIVLTKAVSMSTSSSSDCQGATFTIPLRATGQTA
ncbi:hypothetical protein BJ986_001796 [Phycicoccus badiiscoriae]|uniref:Uncharacterized protein n=1 Tax=Pedococcus badiiscoriae TaxID=642776 RepID=A0A852WEV3_9MICO|nr:hypothetical protein [Pedococcus badiiscoriae]NYG07309.1 hypothetical protein [Pedococcus badiiscoriae]